MIVWGWGKRTGGPKGAALVLKCERCGNLTYFDLVQHKTWFTIFFIPVVPYENENILACRVCTAGYALKSRQAVMWAEKLAAVTSRWEKKELSDAEYQATLSDPTMSIGEPWEGITQEAVPALFGLPAPSDFGDAEIPESEGPMSRLVRVANELMVRYPLSRERALLVAEQTEFYSSSNMERVAKGNAYLEGIESLLDSGTPIDDADAAKTALNGLIGALDAHKEEAGNSRLRIEDLTHSLNPADLSEDARAIIVQDIRDVQFTRRTIQGAIDELSERMATVRAELERASRGVAGQTEGSNNRSETDLISFCPGCGSRVAVEWKFCRECGDKQP